MKLRWIILGVVVVVAAAIGFGAWYVFGDNPPAKPKLAVDAPVQTGGPATPDGTWKVVRGKDVYVGYRMTEVFAGDIVHKTAVGRTPVVDGTATIAGNKVTAATVTADLRQLASNRGARDNYIHTHAIESDTFPNTTFKLTAPITLPTPLKKGVEMDVSAVGQLTLHGVTKGVTVPLKAQWLGPTIQVVGEASVVLADYKIEPPDTGVVKVDNHGALDISFSLAPR